jgi:hypothetical protein
MSGIVVEWTELNETPEGMYAVLLRPVVEQ